MSLRYCLQCKKITADEQAVLNRGHYFCPGCKNPLTYFGKEDVSLSTPDLLAAYDATHKKSPVESFHGHYENYFTPKVDLEILECEGIIKNDPQNIGALMHLSILYKSRNELEKAKSYLLKVFKVDDEYVDAHKHFADILLCEGHFKEARSALEILVLIENETVDNMFNLGVAHMCIGELEKALECYEKSVKLCVKKERKDTINQVIEQVKESLGA